MGEKGDNDPSAVIEPTAGTFVGGRSSWLSRNLLALSVASLLTDTASEMVVPLLPAFLTGVLGAGAVALGWMEGLADAVSSVLKLVSGRWSDRMGKKQPLVAAGYGLATVARPLIAAAAAPWHVLALRIIDRAGKGLRTSPRDALIAASVPADRRGVAFGFHRGMDHVGAVLGPLIAVLLLGFVTDNLRTIFWLSAIPGVLAVLSIVLGVKERAVSTERRESAPEGNAGAGRPLLFFLIPLGLFTLGNASDLFILLKAQQANTSLGQLPLLWMLIHIVKAATSLPSGWVADRWGHRKVIVAGWVLYAAVYAGFALVESRAAVWALFIVYGCYYGLTEAAESALVARIVPARWRGTAFGWYHLTVGMLTLAANVLFGFLWDGFGGRTAFMTCAALAIAASGGLALAGWHERHSRPR